MATVTLNAVGKQYPGGGHAVRDLSLEVADGEFIVLVGPSGCGKTTTLRMIAGLEDIGTGEIRIGGRCVNEVPPKDRDVAMVFQNYALYPHMSVFENMAFGLTLRRLPRAEIERRVGQTAAILGLQALLGRKPGTLSGGQRQRVAMGRAMVRQPAVFLFDEPLSNLDARMRVDLRVELKSLHQRLRVTMIYVTHDQVEAMTLGDRIVVMHEGQARQVGSPMEVYDRPRDRFVAGFIGTPAMNLIDGRCDAAMDGAAFLGPPDVAGTPLSVAFSGIRGPGSGAVTLGVRPEHLCLVSDGGAGFQARVRVIEALGAHQIAHLQCGELALTALLDGHIRLTPGEIRHWAIRPGRAHLFDGITGFRLEEIAPMPALAAGALASLAELAGIGKISRNSVDAPAPVYL